jgi:hypothetical protein
MSDTKDVEAVAPAPPQEEQQQQQEQQQQEEETHVPVHDVTATTVEGARVRRSTQKFVPVERKADEPDEFTPPVGSGTKVKDIPVVGESVSDLCRGVLRCGFAVCVHEADVFLFFFLYGVWSGCGTGQEKCRDPQSPLHGDVQSPLPD